MAAFWGHLGTVKYLHGKVSPFSKRFFHWSVDRVAPSNKGASVDVAAYNGWTPLFAATAMLADSIEIVKYLHLSGARVG